MSTDFAAAAKCLQHVVTTVAMNQEAVEWDKGMCNIVCSNYNVIFCTGFQAMLAASQTTKSNKKSCKAVEIFCNGVIPPLQNTAALIGTRPAQLTTPASLAHHLDHLTMCRHHLITPVTVSLHAISSLLVTSLEMSRANNSLPKLAQYIFSDAPNVHHSVRTVESEVREIIPLKVLSPAVSGWCVREKELHTKYGDFCSTFIYMSVSV